MTTHSMWPSTKEQCAITRFGWLSMLMDATERQGRRMSSRAQLHVRASCTYQVGVASQLLKSSTQGMLIFGVSSPVWLLLLILNSSIFQLGSVKLWDNSEHSEPASGCCSDKRTAQRPDHSCDSLRSAETGPARQAWSTTAVGRV